MKRLICAIYERRPRTQRSIRDNRAAKLIDKVEFNGESWRPFEIASELKDNIEDRGYTVAGVPYKTNHAEFDWVAYVNPIGLGSPVRREKKKPVRVGTGLASKRLPLPTRGQRVKKATAAPKSSSVVSTRPVKKAKEIPPRKRPAKLPMKRSGQVQKVVSKMTEQEAIEYMKTAVIPERIR